MVKKNKIIEYTCLFNSGDDFKTASIGRVFIAKKERKFGYGNHLMEASINAVETHLNETFTEISAQKYLQKFYESHQFKQIGEEYLEDGIPHIRMEREF